MAYIHSAAFKSILDMYTLMKGNASELWHLESSDYAIKYNR